MTPINSMLPIASAAPDQAVAEGSPLAGFGELIAGLILQGEQEFSSLPGQGQDETVDPLPEEQVSTAMLLASLPVTIDEVGVATEPQLLPEVTTTDTAEAAPNPPPALVAIPETPAAPPAAPSSVPAEVPPAQGATASPVPAADIAAPHDQDLHPEATTSPAVGDVDSAEVEAEPARPAAAAMADRSATIDDGASEIDPSTTRPSGDSPITPVTNQPGNPGDDHTGSPSSNPMRAGEPVTPTLGGASPAHSGADLLRDGRQEPATRPLGVETSALRTDPAPQAVSNAAPSLVPNAQSAPAVEVPHTVIARVEQAIEMVENAPPPRRITIDAAELDGVRLTVSVRPDGVAVTSQTADPSVIEAIERALAARGFDLADSGRQGRSPTDRDDHDTWQPPTAPPTRQTTRDQGIRL